ncbi:MAG: LEA type 2 family protein [Fluviicola sp.]|nr:LEA type 2 family protein [Fluviicola sp.]
MERSFFSRFFIIPMLALLFIGGAGCDIDEPDISNIGGFKLKKLDGQRIEAEFSVDCDNPNGFGFKVKKANIDVSANDQILGNVSLDKKVKVKRKSKNTYTIPVIIELEDGALFKIMQLSLSGEVTVLFKGKVRGSVCGIGKSFEVNESKKIDASSLNLDGLGG